MATRKKGLGRGLEALLGPTANANTTESTNNAPPSKLPLTRLVAGQYQPRNHMDEGALYELADSIKTQGIMQPILVRPLSDKQAQQHRKTQTAELKKQLPNVTDVTIAAQGKLYEIIAGERRFRAANIAGLHEVPVLIKSVSDQTAAAMALIENIQREDLNPLEEAQGIQRLIHEFGLTHEQAAQAVGRSRSAASNLLRLLNLTDSVQTMLMAGDIDMGHARALLALDSANQIIAANQISAKKLSVREAENLVKRLVEGQSATAKKASATKDPEIRSVEEELSDLLMAQVEVRIKKQHKQGGQIKTSGELAIQFGSLDALNGLIAHLRRENTVI